jgi:hypothetical protein
MSEDTSLTNAVKLAAGISLTKAVKDVAGRRAWFIDEVLDADDDAAPGAITPRAPRLVAACARLAAFAVLTLAFLQATSTSTVLDGQRGLLPAAHRRVALVVGNSAYRNARLENEERPLMGTALKSWLSVIVGLISTSGVDAKTAFCRSFKGRAWRLLHAGVGWASGQTISFLSTPGWHST